MSRLCVTPDSLFRDAPVRLVMHEEGDADILAQFLANYDVAKFLSRHEPLYVSEEREYIAGLAARKHVNRAFGIWHVHDKRIIGACGLHSISPIHRRATIGIMIGDTTLHGRGFGTHVMKQLVHHGFASLNLHMVTLSVLAPNTRALRCYEKVGFVQCGRVAQTIAYEGGWCDEILMTLHKEQWRTT